MPSSASAGKIARHVLAGLPLSGSMVRPFFLGWLHLDLVVYHNTLLRLIELYSMSLAWAPVNRTILGLLPAALRLGLQVLAKHASRDPLPSHGAASSP